MGFEKLYKKLFIFLLLFTILFTNTNVYALSLADKKGDRDNIAPTASFDAVSKKKVDIIVITDYTGEKLGKLQSSLSEFKANNLAKYDIRTQVADNLPKISIGSQEGTYKKSVYGVVGKAQYLENFKNSWTSWYNKPSEFKVCLNPIVKMPGEPAPADPAIIPTSVNKINKNFQKTTAAGNYYYGEYDIYNFSGPISYVPYTKPNLYPNFEGSDACNWFLRYLSTPTNSITQSSNPETMSFTFDSNVSFYGYESVPSVNTVNTWNLSQISLEARSDSKAFYILAVDNTSTDFYSSDIYNQANVLNYKFANLRDDNLGKYVKDSNAVVLASLPNDAMDTNFKSNTTETGWKPTGLYDSNGEEINEPYPIYKNSKLHTSYLDQSIVQNISLNDLVTQYASDYRLFNNTDMTGDNLIGRIEGFLHPTKNKIDMVIATDKGTQYANALDAAIKSQLGSTVDVKTTITDNSNKELIDSKALYNIKDNFIYKNGLLRIGDRFNNIWYSLGDISTQTETRADVVNANVQDMGSFGITEEDGYTYPYGSYVIEQDGTFYTSTNEAGRYTFGSSDMYFKSVNDSSSRYYGYLKLVTPYKIKQFTPFMANYYDGSDGRTALAFLTEDNNLFVMYFDWSNYQYHVVQVASNVAEVIVDNKLHWVTQSGDIYRWFYNTVKVSSGRSLPKKVLTGLILTQNNELYTTSSYLNGLSPFAYNVRDVGLQHYLTSSYVIYTTNDGKVSRIYVYDTGTTDDDGNTIYYLKLSEDNLPIGKAPKATATSYKDSSYGFRDGVFGNRAVKLIDNTVVLVDVDNNYQESDYTDLVYLDNGLNLYADIYGNIQVQLVAQWSTAVYNNKLNDIITKQIIDKKVVSFESLSNNKIKSTPLRSDADKVFVYISDNARCAAGLGFGTYYPWGTLNKDMLNYLQDNKFAVYFITPKQAMNVKIKAPHDTTIFNQEKSLTDLLIGKVKDSVRFDNQNQFMSFFIPRYSISFLEDPNAIYLVQGEDKLSYNLFYSDFETDPMNALRWRFTHDPAVFENNQGLNPLSGQWLSSFNEEPTQVGKYIIECQAQDRPTSNTLFMNYWKWSEKSEPKTVYVHRRPTANFSIYLNKNGTGYNTSINDNSFDIDRISAANRGITQWKWKWRINGAKEWTYGQLPPFVEKGSVYEVSLEVLDRQGAWSSPKVILVDTMNMPPTVDANPTYADWTNQDVSITVTADDNGENDFNRIETTTTTSWTAPDWVDSTWHQKTVPIKYTQEGIRYLYMRVFDNAGNNSYKFRGPYKIDKTPPGGTAVPYSSGWTNRDVTVTFSPWDNLSGVKMWRYAASSDNGANWGNWTGYASGPTPAAITFNYEGIHRLSAEVTDNAGNVNYVTTGNYLIDKTAPVIIPDNSGPLEVFDSLNVNINVSDNLSGVRETKYAFTQSQDKPSGGWITTTQTNFDAVINQEGTWYLHVESTDNAGNTSYIVIGSFKVIIVRIYDLTVTLINDITWRDYYFEGSAFNAGGAPSQFTRKDSTDIKASRMPINNYNSSKTIEYSRDGIDSGCEVSFYQRSYGNPENVAVIAHYVTDDGERTTKIQPQSVINELWSYTFTVPLECKLGTYISFDVEASKNGTIYGNDRWVEPWLPLNTDRKIFYISGNVIDRLKFNQSH